MQFEAREEKATRRTERYDEEHFLKRNDEMRRLRMS
jgi:hypothetical protein